MKRNPLLLTLLLCLLLPALLLQADVAAGLEKEEAPLMEGNYKIRNKATGRLLNMQLAGMVDRAYVHQFGKTDMLDEIWRLKRHEEGWRIQNLFSPRFLALREEVPAAGGAIHVSTAEVPGADWALLPEAGGWRLVPLHGEGDLGVTLPVNDIASKHLPQLLPFTGEDTAIWLFEPVSLAEKLPTMLPLTGQVFHASCPQIIKHDGVYYMIIMAPHILIKASRDLIHWEVVDTVFGKSDPAWLAREVPGYGIWAPAAFFFNGKYHLYYCISTIGSQNSAIGLVTNQSLNPQDPAYKWVDEGMVMRSFTGSPWNCIDPNIIIGEDGRIWMNWGSYWGGIYQREINPETGHLMQPEEDRDKIHHLARRTVNNGAVEAPYMIARDGWYYLFVAFNPMDLSYHNRVGRSRSLHGPFLDREGREMTQGGGSVVTKGMYELRMPGHASVFEDEDGQHYFVGEYFRKDSPSIMMVSTIVWDDEGWPVTALSPDIARLLPGTK